MWAYSAEVNCFLFYDDHIAWHVRCRHGEAAQLDSGPPSASVCVGCHFGAETRSQLKPVLHTSPVQEQHAQRADQLHAHVNQWSVFFCCSVFVYIDIYQFNIAAVSCRLWHAVSIRKIRATYRLDGRHWRACRVSIKRFVDKHGHKNRFKKGYT